MLRYGFKNAKSSRYCVILKDSYLENMNRKYNVRYAKIESD